MKKFLYLVITFTCLSNFSFSQEVNKNIAYTTVYDYLDLKEVEKKKEMLTVRQQKDLDFFLKDYNKEYYPDKKF